MNGEYSVIKSWYTGSQAILALELLWELSMNPEPIPPEDAYMHNHIKPLTMLGYWTDSQITTSAVSCDFFLLIKLSQSQVPPLEVANRLPICFAESTIWLAINFQPGKAVSC